MREEHEYKKSGGTCGGEENGFIMGGFMNGFFKKKAIRQPRMEIIMTFFYIGAWGVLGVMGNFPFFFF